MSIDLLRLTKQPIHLPSPRRESHPPANESGRLSKVGKDKYRTARLRQRMLQQVDTRSPHVSAALVAPALSLPRFLFSLPICSCKPDRLSNPLSPIASATPTPISSNLLLGSGHHATVWAANPCSFSPPPLLFLPCGHSPQIIQPPTHPLPTSPLLPNQPPINQTACSCVGYSCTQAYRLLKRRSPVRGAPIGVAPSICPTSRTIVTPFDPTRRAERSLTLAAMGSRLDRSAQKPSRSPSHSPLL